ncbi:MAG TPA: acyltransferase [Acidobacteriaceae bacterium]|jgi:peptidoglycan/LPS O-acetylase OafA/YrhL|nr:acyltransferase [Acidobacteriaceae bacterium]
MMDLPAPDVERQSAQDAPQRDAEPSRAGAESSPGGTSWVRRFAVELREQYHPRSALHAIVSVPAFHEPVIDGVRAIAIVWVLSVHLVLYHVAFFPQTSLAIFNLPGLHVVARGDLGVDLFFVISGYLIGTILFREAAKTGSLRLRRFYLRRFLRLIPVYTAAMILALWFLHGYHASKIWANLLYVNNFLPIDRQFMPWCWSLAIEEQFYLLLPAFVLFLMTLKRGRWLWMLALFVLAGLIRWSIIRSHGILPPFTDMPGMPSYDHRLTVIYQNLYTRYGALLVGVMTSYALLFHRAAVEKFFSRRLAVNVIGVACLLTMTAIAFTSFGYPAATPSTVPAHFFDGIFNRFSPPWRQLWYTEHRDVFALCTAFLIVAALVSPAWIGVGVRRMLSWRVFRPVAQLSYSLYLTHELVLVWLFPRSAWHLWNHFGVGAAMALDSLIALCIMFALAAALFVLIEKPSMDARTMPSIRALIEPQIPTAAPQRS